MTSYLSSKVDRDAVSWFNGWGPIQPISQVTSEMIITYNNNLSLLLLLGVSWGHWSTWAQRSTWTKGTTSSLRLSLSPPSVHYIHPIKCMCSAVFQGLQGARGPQGPPGPQGTQVRPFNTHTCTSAWFLAHWHDNVENMAHQEISIGSLVWGKTQCFSFSI